MKKYTLILLVLIGTINAYEFMEKLGIYLGFDAKPVIKKYGLKYKVEGSYWSNAFIPAIKINDNCYIIYISIREKEGKIIKASFAFKKQDKTLEKNLIDETIKLYGEADMITKSFYAWKVKKQNLEILISKREELMLIIKYVEKEEEEEGEE